MGLKLFAGLLLSIILSVLILGFIVSFSVILSVNESNLDELAREAIEEVIVEEAGKIQEEVASRGEAYEDELKEMCGESGTVTYEGVEVDCSGIDGLDSGEIEQIVNVSGEEIASEFSDELDGAISQVVETRINPYIKYLRWGIWGIGIAALLFIFLLFLISERYYGLLGYVGLSFLLAGSAYFFTENVRAMMEFRFFELSTIDALVTNIFSTIQDLLLLSMVTGGTLIILGFFGAFHNRNKWPKKYEKQRRMMELEEKRRQRLEEKKKEREELKKKREEERRAKKAEKQKKTAEGEAGKGKPEEKTKRGKGAKKKGRKKK